MATVQRETIGNLHDKLIVTLSKEDYYPKFEKSLKQHSKNANVPGFRKGNVPAGMIKKMYGQSLFIDEVLKTANSELESYLKENKPSIFGQPLPMMDSKLELDMNKSEDLNFEFEIGIKPDFNIDIDSLKGKVTHYKIQVDEEMMNQEIENLRKRTGETKEAESVENDEDMIHLDYEPANENGEVIEGEEKMQDVQELKDLPEELAKLLKGKKATESFTIQPSKVLKDEELKTFMKKTLQKSEDDQAAQDAFYKVTITKITILEPREINEEFFEAVFPNSGLKDEAAFRERLKEEIKKEASRFTTEKLQNDIFETLVHQIPIELPVPFLKSWLKKGGEKEKTDTEIEAEFPAFDHQLRWTLISDKLMTENKIEVSLDEVMADVKSKMMAYFGMSGVEDAPWMDSYLEKMSKDEKTMDETYRRLLFDKLFSKLEQLMDVAEQEVTQEEFNKIPHEHHH